MHTKTASSPTSSRHTRKRKALRAAFVVTAALGAAGCGSEITNPPIGECPSARPSTGDSCDEPMECVYDDECDLEVTASCGDDGVWAVQYGGTCNPPPPSECPEEAPANGDACDFEIGSCTYEGQCGEPFNATCEVDGWSVDTEVSCNPPPPCPQELPGEGDACELTPGGTPIGCSYEVSTACGPQIAEAECGVSEQSGEVVWFVALPTCKPKVPDCGAYRDSAPCDADTTCRWLVPGCGEGEADFEPACFPIDDCSGDSCGPDAECVTVNHDPCWNSGCGACGADASVCAAIFE